MTVARPPQPSGDNFKTWGARLNDYLVRTRSQLVQYVAGTSAVDDGMLVWDADNSRVLYSYDGAWLPIAGTGSGTPASLFYNGAAKITATADGVTAFGNITLSGFPESSYEIKGDIDGSVRFHAVASEALSKGDVVYIVEHASSGSETKVAKALASDAAKMPAFGLALDDAATDAAVQIVTFGNLYGSGGAGNALDTSAYNSGTPLYVSATTAGEWTGTAPTGETNLIQNIGKVVRKQQTNGVIKVGGAGRTNATPNLNNGNFFIGNSSNQAVTASFATQVAAAEVNDLSTTVTWANVPDANITESSVTQHLTAANVTSPLTGGTGITIASDGTFTNSLPDQTVALTGTGATTVTGTYPNFTIDSTNTTYTVGDGGLTTNDFTDADHNKLDGIEANADVTDTANVTSAGALMDSEVTNLAQVKAFDSSDYATASQGVIIATAEYDASAINLGTSANIVWTEFDTPAYNEKKMHTARFEIDLNSGSSTYRNEVQFYIYITVPSGETAYSLGTATYESAPATYGRIISFSGDITDKISLGGSIGLNLDSSGYFADRTLDYYYYSNSDDKTYVRYNSYPSELISSGNSATIYFDPFHFASTGSDLIVEQYTIELPYNNQDSVITLKTKLGYIQQAFDYSLRAKETNTGDTIVIYKVRHELTTRKV